MPHTVGNKKCLRASLVMAAALVTHFFGYECARSASIALLASKERGLGSEALTYTVAIGSPAGALILYLYARSIRYFGPHFTLRMSEFGSLFIMLFVILMCDKLSGISGQLTTVCYYAFREIYVSLLSTQHWSFIASTLDTSASSFVVSIAGAVSVSSALGGCAVEHLVYYFGVRGLLVASFVATILSVCFSESAYYISYTHKNTSTTTTSSSPNKSTNIPTNNNSNNKSSEPSTQKHVTKSTPVAASKSSSTTKTNIWIEFWYIMYRSPTLRLLYVEAICHQLVSNTLNLMFHDYLRISIQDNATRAVMVGRFFATVNVTSCILQIFVLPSILCAATLPHVLSAMPVIIFIATLFGWLKPSLGAVMMSFGTLKVLEYSIMTAAGEMIYMPMTHDDRYLGKEVIRFFGQKLGKSGSSILLSAAAARLQPSLSFMCAWAGVGTLIWSVATSRLAAHLLLRDAAANSKSPTKDTTTTTSLDLSKDIPSPIITVTSTSTTTSSSTKRQCSESRRRSTSSTSSHDSEYLTSGTTSESEESDNFHFRTLASDSIDSTNDNNDPLPINTKGRDREKRNNIVEEEEEGGGGGSISFSGKEWLEGMEVLVNIPKTTDEILIEKSDLHITTKKKLLEPLTEEQHQQVEIDLQPLLPTATATITTATTITVSKEIGLRRRHPLRSKNIDIVSGTSVTNNTPSTSTSSTPTTPLPMKVHHHHHHHHHHKSHTNHKASQLTTNLNYLQSPTIKRQPSTTSFIRRNSFNGSRFVRIASCSIANLSALADQYDNLTFTSSSSPTYSTCDSSSNLMRLNSNENENDTIYQPLSTDKIINNH